MPEQKKEARTIFGLALPAIFSMLSLTLVEIVDAIFIGRLGPLPLAASALIMLLIWNIRNIAEGFGVGLTACVSRMVGSGDYKNSSLFFRTGVIFFFLFGIVLVPVLYFAHPSIFRVMQMPDELFSYSRSYMNIFLFFIPFHYLFITMESGYRAAGDTRTPMIIGIGMNGVNILLDWLLVFGNWGFPRMEIGGAALASGISYISGAAAITLLSSRKKWGPFRQRSGPVTAFLSGSHLKKILRFGAPATIERVAMSASQIVVMAIAITPLGSYSVAGFQIVLRLASLSFMPGFGFSVAAATLSGQGLGAGKPRQAGRMVWKTLLWSELVFGLISILYFTLPELLVSLFTETDAVITMTRTPLRIYASCALFLAPTMIMGGGLRGAGDTRFPMIIMFISRFLIRIPVCWFMSIVLGLGLTGVWIGMCSDFIIRAVALTLKFRQGKWKEIKL